MRFRDNVAVVTGAGSGIGEETALEFAAEGAHVVVVDVDGDAAARTAASIVDRGGSAAPVAQDVSDQDGTREAMAAVIADRGRIDYLVNNAISFIAKGLDVTTADWNHVLGVNIRGYANMVQACHAGLCRSGGAAVVNIASISAFIAQPNRWTYNSTKGAIVEMTRCMALDLSADSIRVNSVSPGWVWTREVLKAADGDRERWDPVWGRFHMLRRCAEPREIARPILFLCSEDASFVTGTDLAVDGGYLSLSAEGLGEQSSFAGSH